MTNFKIFAIIITTFFLTVLAVNQVHKRDHNNDIEELKSIHKHETDSLKREIIELEDCLFVKKIAESN